MKQKKIIVTRRISLDLPESIMLIIKKRAKEQNRSPKNYMETIMLSTTKKNLQS